MCRVAVVVSSANMELELVRQCLDRALVLDDRVSKFSVQLGEWPGDMAKLLDFLSREDVRSAASALQTLGATQWCLQFIGLCGFSPARLLDVCHRTQSDRSDLFKAKVREPLHSSFPSVTSNTLCGCELAGPVGLNVVVHAV